MSNGIMRTPCWEGTAIFLSWEDWGGFYGVGTHTRIASSAQQSFPKRSEVTASCRSALLSQ